MGAFSNLLDQPSSPLFPMHLNQGDQGITLGPAVAATSIACLNSFFKWKRSHPSAHPQWQTSSFVDAALEKSRQGLWNNFCKWCFSVQRGHGNLCKAENQPWSWRQALRWVPCTRESGDITVLMQPFPPPRWAGRAGKMSAKPGPKSYSRTSLWLRTYRQVGLQCSCMRVLVYVELEKNSFFLILIFSLEGRKEGRI